MRAHDLNGAFNSFCTGVAEKHAIQSAGVDQFFGQLALIFVVVKIGAVNQTGGLFANGTHHTRMRMTKGVHPDSGNQIQITAAIGVVQIATLTAFQHHGITAIVAQYTFAFQRNDTFGLGHLFFYLLQTCFNH